MCVLSHVQLFAVPWTIVHQALLSMEFSRQEYWSGLPFPTPGDLPHPGIKHASLSSPALADIFFITSTTSYHHLKCFFKKQNKRQTWRWNSCASPEFTSTWYISYHEILKTAPERRVSCFQCLSFDSVLFWQPRAATVCFEGDL